MIAEMWKNMLEGEGLPTKILPEGDIRSWGERVPYRVMVPRGPGARRGRDIEEAVVNDWLEIAAWLVFLLPLASFVLIVAFIRPFFNQFADVAGRITIGAIAIAFVLALVLFVEVVQNGGTQIGWTGHEWLVVGDFELRMGIFMDGAYGDHARRGDGRESPRSNLFHRLHEGRPRLRAVLRLYVVLHRVYDRLGCSRQRNTALRVFGSWSACRHTC